MPDARTGIIAILLAGATLGACGPGPAYFGADRSALYDRREVQYAAAQGPVPLTIRGEPFAGVDPETVARATAAALARAPAMAPMRPTRGDPGPRSVDYRIVLLFGESRPGSENPCVAPPGPRGEGVAATMGFCIGERMISAVRGRLTGEIQGPEDPRFAAFLSGLTAALLPTYNAHMQGCVLPRC